MIRKNPNPHEHGYQYEPTRAVTAIFDAGRDVDNVLKSLEADGFAPSRIDVFQGTDGADLLDPEGTNHGAWVRLRRFITGQFDEGREVLHKADEELRAGGTVVEVFTHGEPVEKERAAEILKAGGGHDVMYWGRLMAEYL